MLTRRNLLKNGGIAAMAAASSGLLLRAAWSSQPPSTFDYYIAPNGDDNNAGTLASPWSITALNTKQSIYAGKNIGIIGDVGGAQTPITYGTVGGVRTTLLSIQNANAGTSSYCVLKINGGTSSAAPTYIASCTSGGVYSPRWAAINGGITSSNANANTILMGQSFYGQTPPPNVGYVTLDGLDISGGAYGNVAFGDVQSTVLHGITIQNCYIHDGYCSTSSENPGGVILGTNNGTLITNTKIANCLTTGGTLNPLGMAAVRTYGTVNLIVTNCTFYNCGFSILMKDGNQWCTVSYCYLDSGNFGSSVNNPSNQPNPYTLMAIIPGAGQTYTVHHNIILGLGMRCWGDDGTDVTGSIVAYNNTFYTPPAFAGPCTALWVTQTGTGPHQWYNNLVHYPAYEPSQGLPYQYGAVAWSTTGGLSASTINSNYYGTGCTFGAGAAYTFSGWQKLGYDAKGLVGGSPFSGIPIALTPTSFAVTGPAATASRTGGPVGALDGTGTVGCNFSAVPSAPTLTVS